MLVSFTFDMLLVRCHLEEIKIVYVHNTTV